MPKRNLSLFSQFFSIFCSLFLFTLLAKPVFAQQKSIPDEKIQQFAKPVIKAGVVSISGQIKTTKEFSKANSFVQFTIPLPITGELTKHKIPFDSTGKFSASFDVEFTNNFNLISIPTLENQSLYFNATQGVNNYIELEITAQNEVKIINTKPYVKDSDMLNYVPILHEMASFIPDREPQDWSNTTPKQFFDYAFFALNERLDLLKNGPEVSESMKDIIKQEYSLHFYAFNVFGYLPVIFSGQKDFPSFLKELNLNQDKNLYAMSFIEFQNEILTNEAFYIPKIGDLAIETWLSEVKETLGKVIGFQEGLYYEWLAANAYGLQLNLEGRPLSEKQKQNIQEYWKNGEIAKILLSKSLKVDDLAKKRTSLVVNDVSNVAPEKVMEAILAKYPNKVVLVDYWATWCGPCLEAMNEFKETKADLKNKDIVFVYLTNKSSPQKLWESTIQGIGSEHYYLTDNQWSYLQDTYQFVGIPFYLIFDKKAQLSDKFTGYPGNEKMKEMLLKHLK